MKHAIGLIWLANPNQGRSSFSHNVWSSWEHLTHYQLWWFLCSLNGHIDLLNYVDYWTWKGHHILNLQPNIFQTHVFLFLFLDRVPLKYRGMIKISNGLRHLYLNLHQIKLSNIWVSLHSITVYWVVKMWHPSFFNIVASIVVHIHSRVQRGHLLVSL